jgi:hypothetical protein
VIEVVGKSSAAGCKRLSHSLEGINPCVHGISAPSNSRTLYFSGSKESRGLSFAVF